MEEKFEMLWKMFDEVVQGKLITKDDAIPIGIALIEAQVRSGWHAENERKIRETNYLDDTTLPIGDFIQHELASHFPGTKIDMAWMPPARHWEVGIWSNDQLLTALISKRKLLSYRDREGMVKYAVGVVRSALDRAAGDQLE